jgi:hypothetical protein
VATTGVFVADTVVGTLASSVGVDEGNRVGVEGSEGSGNGVLMATVFTISGELTTIGSPITTSGADGLVEVAPVVGVGELETVVSSWQPLMNRIIIAIRSNIVFEFIRLSFHSFQISTVCS